jgi:hypothetical protein
VPYYATNVAVAITSGLPVIQQERLDYRSLSCPISLVVIN